MSAINYRELAKAHLDEGNVHVLPASLVEARSATFAGHDNYGHQFEADVELRGKFRHEGRESRYSVHYGDEYHWTRTEYDGPVDQIEHAYLAALPALIVNAPGQVPGVVDVQDGDLILIVGRTLQIRDDQPWSPPRLVRVL